jgi:hypothetical protein
MLSKYSHYEEWCVERRSSLVLKGRLLNQEIYLVKVRELRLVRDKPQDEARIKMGGKECSNDLDLCSCQTVQCSHEHSLLK